jgi:hypothetical protein
MIHIPPIIERIKELLNEDTEQSVTFAALEARLALEKICYDRLRQRHDYISHDQLRRWQPGALMNTLMTNVDQHVTKTTIFSVGKNPSVPGITPDDDDYVEIGTEVGFEPKLVTKMWNALAKLALHVRLPEHVDDQIADYGDKALIQAKVEEVIAELERIAEGTMVFSGIGEEISFPCSCGETNKRRAELLNDGQHVYCINPECKITWKAIKSDDGFRFQSVTIPVNCEVCQTANYIPWRHFLDMKHDQFGGLFCRSCQHKNYVQWQLVQVKPPPTP